SKLSVQTFRFRQFSSCGQYRCGTRSSPVGVSLVSNGATKPYEVASLTPSLGVTGVGIWNLFASAYVMPFKIYMSSNEYPFNFPAFVCTVGTSSYLNFLTIV